MNRKIKFVLVSIALFFSTLNILAAETRLWNISNVSGKPDKYKFKEYKGPFESKEIAVANWIYEELPMDSDLCITSFIIDENKEYKDQKLESKDPSNTFTKIYADICKEFNKDRYNTLNKYRIVPIQKIEKKFTKKSNIFVKKVHPRTYVFDIFDISNEIFLSYANSRSFDCTIDFTSLCLNDMPQKNDKITIYYDGKTSNILKNLEIGLYTKIYVKDPNNPKKQILIDKLFDKQTIVEKAEKNERFSGNITFDITENCNQQVYIKIVNYVKNEKFQIDQTFLRFKRVVESTNTVREAEEEKAAGQKSIEIVEVKNTILEEEIKQKELEEQKQLELQKAKAEEELKRKQEEEERKIQEQLALQLEKDRQQQDELEKVLAQANKKSSVSRYQREYLQDFESDEVYGSLKKSNKKSNFTIDDPDEIDATGKTLLMKAAKSGNDWQIRNLIEAGANVNMQDKDGWTALMYAVRYQENLTAVTLLLNSGADLYIENNFKTSALTIATCYNNNPEILKQILKYYESSNKDVLKSLTMLFVSSQPSEFIQLAKLDVFIQKAVPINTYYEGKTPLMYACQYGNSTEAIKVLLDNNAAVTLRSSEGKSAFDYASKNTNLEHDDIYWSLNRKR